MCFLRPLKITKIVGKKYFLEGKIEAIADKKVGRLKVGDRVVVYGNLILNKVRNND